MRKSYNNFMIVTIDKQHEDRLTALKNRCNFTNSYVSLIKQMIESVDPFSWKLLDYLLTSAEAKDRAHYLQLKMEIQRSFRNIKTFTMLLYMYMLKDKKKQFSFYSSNWKSDYDRVYKSVEEFSSLLSFHSSAKIIQETLGLLIKVFPKMMKNQYIKRGKIQTRCIIQWVTYFKTAEPETEKYYDVCQLIKVAKQNRNQQQKDFNLIQHTLLQQLIESVCQVKDSSSNVFLFIYPFYPLTKLNQQMRSFCTNQHHFISNLGEEALLNFFVAATKSSMTHQILYLLLHISQLLKAEQQFFKLRHLYQNFILPILAKRSKICKRVEENVLEISKLYIIGFLKHCDIGVEGISCITKDVGKIKNQVVKQKWIQLCAILCSEYPDLSSQMRILLKKEIGQNFELKIENNLIALQDSRTIWDITIRTGRKHKKYVEVPSKMIGIFNQGNQCYIISTVHGIQKVELLQRLIQKYREQIRHKHKLLYQLKKLFKQFSQVLQNNSYQQQLQLPRVSYLKKASSPVFGNSQNQEDAREYLESLFGLIQLQMKDIHNDMLQQFNQLFQIREVKTICCRKCNYRREKECNNYIYTLHYSQILSQITEEEVLTDYKCSQCQTLNTSTSVTRIFPNKVLIVAISRLSNTKQGDVVKQLSTQRILRSFMTYQLVGIVSHIGKTVNSGHYEYWHRINTKRWAHFNDKYVTEFQLSEADEQFERQWKSSMTPYILFYRKNQS